MKILTFRSLLIFTMSLILSTGAAETGKSIKKEVLLKPDLYPPTPQGGLYNSSYSNKSPLGDLGVNFCGKTFETLSLLKQPRKAKKAQKKADKKKKDQKEAIRDGSKAAQKRSYEIQSPEVKARMKQDKKNIAARDKAKKKSNKSKTKRGAKKYN